MSTEPILDIRDLKTQFFTPYGVVRAVDGISFSVSPAEVFGIVGESGCGKSVTALSILRLVPPPGKITGGEIRLNNRNILELPGDQMRALRGKEVSMVFQDPLKRLNPALTIGWQLSEALQAHRSLPNRVARQKVIEALHSVGIPDPAQRTRAYPHEFSGGMNQRVMIAVAMINEPGILIADEPTTALDVTIQAQILELMKLLAREYGMGIVLITHNMAVVASMCDRVAVMYAGEIVEEAPVEELFHRPLHPYTRGLLLSLPRADKISHRLPAIPGFPPDLINPPTGCRFRDRCLLVEEACKKHPDLIELKPGHPVRCWVAQRGDDITMKGWINLESASPAKALPEIQVGDNDGYPTVPEKVVQIKPGKPRAIPEAATFLEIKGLVKHFKVRKGVFGKGQIVHAVDGVSLGVYKGETLGIVGESGCGKSTLSRLVVGLEDPTSGSILVEGLCLSGRTPQSENLRRQMQMVFQDPSASLDPRMLIKESIAEPLVAQGHVSAKERRERAHELLALVGLKEDLADRYPHELSGGQQQRVCIARALIANPSLVVADEAVSSLDVSLQAQVLNLLRDLQERLGLTYIFISHDLAVVQSMSTRIGVMYLGKVIELAPVEAFIHRPLHPYSIALKSAVPIPDPRLERKRSRIVLQGDVPSPMSPPTGCRFHTRCMLAQDICRQQEPPLIEYENRHWAACHFVEKAGELL